MRWLILTSVQDQAPVYINLNESAMMFIRGTATRIIFNSLAGSASPPSYLFVDVTETPDEILAMPPVVLP